MKMLVERCLTFAASVSLACLFLSPVWAAEVGTHQPKEDTCRSPLIQPSHTDGAPSAELCQISDDGEPVVQGDLARQPYNAPPAASLDVSAVVQLAAELILAVSDCVVVPIIDEPDPFFPLTPSD
jgi:hypothetical protein